MTIYRFSSIVKPIFLTRSPKTGDMKRIDQRDTSMVIQPHLPAGQTQDSVWVYLRRVEVVLAVMLLCELNTGGKISGICEIAPFKCQTQYCWMLHSFSWVSLNLLGFNSARCKLRLYDTGCSHLVNLQ